MLTLFEMERRANTREVPHYIATQSLFYAVKHNRPAVTLIQLRRMLVFMEEKGQLVSFRGVQLLVNSLKTLIFSE